MGGRVGERAGTASEIALPRFPKQTSENRPAVASRDRAEHGDKPERQQHDVHAVEPGEGGIGKIGRASGRERVCKYVSISVVAGTLKKKHHETNYNREL